jgi:hypothetical protein
MVDVETLELVADWKDDLRARLARAMLVYETIGAGREDVIALGAEVQAFTGVCQALKSVLRDDHEGRET